MKSVVENDNHNSLMEYSRRQSIGGKNHLKQSLLTVQHDNTYDQNESSLMIGPQSLFYKPETNKNYPQNVPTKLPQKLSAQMKKDVKNIHSLKNDKSLRILLDSIEDYPQRLKAFKKYVKTVQQVNQKVASVSRSRIASGGRSSASPDVRGTSVRSDLILYLDSISFADDVKFCSFLTMLKDDVWKYEVNQGIRSRSRSGSPSKKQMLVLNNVKEIRIENCNIKSSKLVQIFEGLSGSLSLERIHIKGLRSPLRDNVIHSITQLIKSLPKTVQYRSKSRGRGHLFTTMASTIKILNQITPPNQNQQRQQPKYRSMQLRIEDTIISKQSQNYLIEQMVRGKDPTSLSLINIDLDLSEKNPISDMGVENSKMKEKDPIVQLLSLRRFMNIRHLNLSKNRIGLPSILALSKGLIHNQPYEDWRGRNSLRTLNLSYNKLGPQAAKLICESLLDHAGIRSLNLSHNFIGNDGAFSLANLIVFQCKQSNVIARKTGQANLTFGLKTLNVSSNKIGDEGMEMLVQALTPKLLLGQKKKRNLQSSTQNITNSLKSRQNLQVLRAQKNKAKIVIGNLTHYLKLIGLNETLVELRLGAASPDLDENAMKQVAFAIKNNQVLQTLDLGHLSDANFLALQQMIMQHKHGRKRPHLTIVKPKTQVQKTLQNFESQMMKQPNQLKLIKQRLKRDRELQAYLVNLDDRSKALLQDRLLQQSNIQVQPQLLNLLQPAFQHQLRQGPPKQKKPQSRRRSLRGPRGSSGSKIKDKPVINISTVQEKQIVVKDEQQEQQQNDSSLYNDRQIHMSGEVSYQERNEFGGDENHEEQQQQNLIEMNVQEQYQMDDEEEEDQEDPVEEEPDDEIIERGEGLKREDLDEKMNNYGRNQEMEQEQMDQQSSEQENFQDQENEQPYENRQSQKQSQQEIEQSASFNQKSKEPSQIEEEPDDETVDFDLSKSRSRMDSKSKGLTPQYLGTTINRTRQMLDSTDGPGKSSKLKSNSYKENNNSSVITNKNSPNKSSKQSAINQDIILEDNEYRLMQMKQMSQASPGGIVAVPEHPDKIFDYDQVEQLKQIPSNSTIKPPRSGKDEQSQKMFTERQAVSITSKDQPVSSNKVGSKSSPSALSSIAPNQTQDPFLPGIGSTSHRIKTALTNRQDSQQQIPTDFRDHEQQSQEKSSQIIAEQIVVQETSFQQQPTFQNQSQEQDYTYGQIDETYQHDLTAPREVFPPIQIPRDSSQIFDEMSKQDEIEMDERREENRWKVDKKLIDEYYDTSSERFKEMSQVSEEDEDDEQLQNSFYHQTTHGRSQRITKQYIQSGISRYHETTRSCQSEMSSEEEEEENTQTSGYYRTRYDQKLKEIKELKTELLEQQLQEKLKVKEMSYRYQNTHSLRRKFYGRQQLESSSSKQDDEGDDMFILTRTNVATESKYRNTSKKSIDFEYVISSSSKEGYQAEEELSARKKDRKDSSDDDGGEEGRSDFSDEDSYDDEDDDQIANLGDSRNQIDMMKNLYRQMKQSDNASQQTPDSRVSQLRQKYQMLDYSKYSARLARNMSKDDNLQSSSDSFRRNYRTQLRQRMRDNESNGSSMQFGDIIGSTFKDNSLSSNKNDSLPRSKLSKY